MTDEIRHGRSAIVVGPTLDPIGRRAVLVQFETGFVIVRPDAARQIAETLTLVAEEVERIDLADPP